MTEEKECSICRETIEKKSLYEFYKCNHPYHNVCINGWLVKHDTCPMCRSIYQSKNKEIFEQKMSIMKKSKNKKSINKNRIMEQNIIKDILKSKKSIALTEFNLMYSSASDPDKLILDTFEKHNTRSRGIRMYLSKTFSTSDLFDGYWTDDDYYNFEFY